MAQHPPIQIVDEHDQPVGQASLHEAFKQGLIHRVVLVIVENEQGQILLQRRGPDVATNANTWDFSAAGYVDVGEDYDESARRELAEELGLQDFDLRRLYIRRAGETHQDFTTDRFAAIYKVVIPAGTPLKLEASEVAETEWFSVAELKQLLENQADEITPFTAGWLWEHYFGDENHGN
ncbi:MAG TPA: NUDIX domain-containing protein [Candidatus Saccharimonadales bacterium]